MAKIRLTDNEMAMFMVCEAIGREIDEWDVKPDENGMHEITIQLDGKELNVERFFESLYRSYCESIKKRAADLLDSKYCDILETIYEIQQSLENHNRLFDEKVNN